MPGLTASNTRSSTHAAMTNKTVFLTAAKVALQGNASTSSKSCTYKDKQIPAVHFVCTTEKKPIN